MLALGDELLVLPDEDYKWRTPGRRYLMPLAEAVLRPRYIGWTARLVAVPDQLARAASSADETSSDAGGACHAGRRQRGDATRCGRRQLGRMACAALLLCWRCSCEFTWL
jgi:hypothetical protein